MKWLNRVKGWGERIDRLEQIIKLPQPADIRDVKKELEQLQADIALWQGATTQALKIDQEIIKQEIKDCREDASLAIHDCSKLKYRMDELEINVVQMIAAVKLLKK